MVTLTATWFNVLRFSSVLLSILLLTSYGVLASPLAPNPPGADDHGYQLPALRFTTIDSSRYAKLHKNTYLRLQTLGIQPEWLQKPSMILIGYIQDFRNLVRQELQDRLDLSHLLYLETTDDGHARAPILLPVVVFQLDVDLVGSGKIEIRHPPSMINFKIHRSSTSRSECFFGQGLHLLHVPLDRHALEGLTLEAPVQFRVFIAIAFPESQIPKLSRQGFCIEKVSK
ncbi:uncharacterized protein MEPE_06101 [Melanopsichium pennsylvanicum]|uniref:Uncharacterized protein n=1 Tax=Melanopsichium pennsylvanicum TaxID=63383 RepID=A0AAJ5C7X9_9BASI|nr:uncharacterized protein MEPE_06101 [Melanopsichium pennsylvanicum]